MQALQETGATGLEPATSGVTDHFSGRDVHDDAQGSAPFMRSFGGLRVEFAWLCERLETFAAHLLPARHLDA